MKTLSRCAIMCILALLTSSAFGQGIGPVIGTHGLEFELIRGGENNGAFYGVEITRVTIPSGVTSIGEKAFWEWDGRRQTINVQGKANQAAADAAWGRAWSFGNNVKIAYLE